MRSSYAITGYFVAVLGTALFSSRGLFIKLAYQEAPQQADAITILALRMGFSLPVYILIGILAWRKTTIKPTPKQLTQILAIGLLGYYAASFLDFAALEHITMQLDRLILFTYPLFVMIFGALFFKMRLTRHGLIALALTYAGITLIFARGEIAESETLWFGAGLALSAAIAFALYQLLAKTMIAQIGSQIFTCIAMSSAGIGVLVHYVLTHSAPVTTLTNLPTPVITYGAIIAFFGTIIPSFLLNEGLNRIGALAVGIVGTVGPIAASILAVTILGEPFGWPEAAGSALILGAIGFYSWKQAKTN